MSGIKENGRDVLESSKLLAFSLNNPTYHNIALYILNDGRGENCLRALFEMYKDSFENDLRKLKRYTDNLYKSHGRKNIATCSTNFSKIFSSFSKRYKEAGLMDFDENILNFLAVGAGTKIAISKEDVMEEFYGSIERKGRSPINCIADEIRKIFYENLEAGYPSFYD